MRILLHRGLPFDCSDRSLNTIDSALFLHNKSSTIDNNTPNHFLPSFEQIQIDPKCSSEKIENVLEIRRWLVILGDPDSAKTAYNYDENVPVSKERSY